MEAAHAEEYQQRLGKINKVLAQRTDRVLLVLERCTDNSNYHACLRTAEALGVQNVWIVTNDASSASLFSSQGDAKVSRKKGRVARQSGQWLDVRVFSSTAECISALMYDAREIWSTDLSPGADMLEDYQQALPARLAVVMGREADGVSRDMLRVSSRRVRLRTYGFTESLNLSVATGLVLQRLFQLCPEARGDMSEQRRASLRQEWLSRLASVPDSAIAGDD